MSQSLDGGGERPSSSGPASLLLFDAAVAAWLWYALQRFTDNTGSLWPGILGPIVAAPAATLLAGLQRFHPGRPVLPLLKALLSGILLASVGVLAASRGWLPMTGREALWLGATTACVAWVARSIYFGTVARTPGAPWEPVRWLVLGTVATLAMFPFYFSGSLGSGDAHWYAVMLADFLTQLRAGVFPVWVGQSPYAFNGAVSPLRYAPGFQYFGGLLDLATGQSLDPMAVRNASLAVVGLLGAFSTYACVRPIAKGSPWVACFLSTLWILCPGVLAPAMDGDQYMTFMAVPFVPLALHGCWRVWQFNDGWGRFWIAAGLAGMWLAHSPVALWFTLISAGIYLPTIFLRGDWNREARSVAAMAVGFIVLGSVPFISILTLENQVKFESSGTAAAQMVARYFPENFMPVDGNAVGIGNYQIGWALLGVLAVALASLIWARPKGIWAFAAAAVLIPVFVVPVPGITQALWSHAPVWFVSVQNVWPMQRLFLAWSALVVFLGAIAAGAPRAGDRRGPGLVLCCLLAAGVLWSGREAFKLARGVLPFRLSPAATHASDDVDNIVLSRYAYSSFEYPPGYFSHSYMEPGLENRLIDLHTEEAFASNSDAAAPLPGSQGAQNASSRLVQSGLWSGHSITTSPYYLLQPGLTLEPGRRYALRVEFLEAGQAGTLQIKGPNLFREYGLPDSGEGVGRRGPPLAFGTFPSSSHVVPLVVGGPAPVAVDSLFIAPAYAGEVLPVAHFWLYSYDQAQLPVSVESWVPYRARVESPRQAFLESPRMWLSGWRALVDGREVPTRRSFENLVLVPVPAGASHVELRYHAPAALTAAFWMGTLGWISLGAGALIQLLLWSGGSGTEFAGLRRLVESAWLLIPFGAISGPLRRIGGNRGLRLAIPILLAVVVVASVAFHKHRISLKSVGPIRVEFFRPHGLAGRSQPLLTTGHDGAAVIVFVTYLDELHARISADVWGTLYSSDPVPMDYRHAQSLVVSDSALYPLDNPSVKAMGPAESARLRGELRVELNGRLVIKKTCFGFETTPAEVLPGSAPFGSTTEQHFLGRIVGVERLPIPRTADLPTGSHVRLSARFPDRAPGVSEPLLTVFSESRIRVCYVTYLAPGRIRLSCWGPAGVPLKSADLTIDPGVAHDLEFDPGQTTDNSASFDVDCYFDGVHVFGRAGAATSTTPLLEIGVNSAGAPGVDARFTGPKLDLSVESDAGNREVAESLGPEHLVLVLPRDRTGRHEPLLTTGHTGAGDFIYLVYEDAGHVRIGLDHWGKGGPVSDPIAVDYSLPHDVVISEGTLFPDIADEKSWSGLDPVVRNRLMSQVSVTLDGKQVLLSPTAAYPCPPGEIVIGKNSIGGSVCELEFSGVVEFAERLGTAPQSGPSK